MNDYILQIDTNKLKPHNLNASIYSFNKEHAKKYGVSEAIVIKNLQFWISKNMANNYSCHDGRTWTYNTISAFQEL